MINATDLIPVFEDNGSGLEQKLVDASSFEWDTPTIIAPTFIGSWANYGAGFQTARYWKDKSGVVHIEGLIKGGTRMIFNLNLGYRPAAAVIIPISMAGSAGEVRIYVSGDVDGYRSSTGWTSISGISFLAA